MKKLKRLFAAVLILGILVFNVYRFINAVPAEKQEEILLGTHDFYGEKIELFYDESSPSGQFYYYQDESDRKYSYHHTLNNKDNTVRFYADYGSVKTILQDNNILEPEEVINSEGIEISIYYLNTSLPVKINDEAETEEYRIMLCNTERKGYCSTRIYIDLNDLERMIQSWKENYDDVNFNRDGQSLLSITPLWKDFNFPIGDVIFQQYTISELRIDGGVYIQIDNEQVKQYLLSDEQISELYNFLEEGKPE